MANSEVVYSKMNAAFDTSWDQHRPIKRRVRTGCLNCRRKHKKCDEQKPVCGACLLRNEECQWPTSEDFKNKKRSKIKRDEEDVEKKEELSHTSHIKTGLPLKSITDFSGLKNYYKNLDIIDNSLIPVIERKERQSLVSTNGGLPEYLSDTSLFPPGVNQDFLLEKTKAQKKSVSISSGSPKDLNVNSRTHSQPTENYNQQTNFNIFTTPSPTDLDQYNSLDYANLQDTLRDFMFTNATNFELNSDIFTPAYPKVISNTESPRTIDTSISFLTEIEEKELLKNYLYNVAPVLDMFDLSRQFGLQTMNLSRKHKSLRFALLALSARHRERLDPTTDPTRSDKLYLNSFKSLIPSVKKNPDIVSITACLMLCVLEFMESSQRKWRYHLEGCSALLKATGINGFSSQYERALFWCFARMDLNSALIGEQNTMIESSKWLPEGATIYDAANLFAAEKGIDMYANYMVFLSSRVLNLISSQETARYDAEWDYLWKEINNWVENRPDQMKSIMEIEQSPFNDILYDNGPAISANQLYHMSIILMLENKPRLVKKSDNLRSAIWHAKQIISISLHNNNHGCWINSVQTLYVAGKLLTRGDEHSVVLNLLNKIETETGWAMRFRANDLIEFWQMNP